MAKDRDTTGALRALSALELGIPGTIPGHTEIRPPQGTLPANRAASKHGWHSPEVVEIPTSHQCNTCVLYALKRKDRRHPLACPEGKRNQLCTVLARRQQQWAEGLLREVQETTGVDPTASDCARIEQIIRHRSRIFVCENFLRVAGMIDTKTGEVRNVADRLTSTENALSRTLAEFRQAIAERRDNAGGQAPRLDEYLKTLAKVEEDGDEVTP